MLSCMTPRAPELYGIPISEIARICHVSLKTAGRWKSRTTCPPRSALLLLAGDLGCLDKAWQGWRVRNGWLISPEAWEIKISDVLSVPILRQRLAAYVTELNRLQAAPVVPQLPEQPMPDAFPAWIFKVSA